MKKIIALIILTAISLTTLTACDGSNKTDKEITAYPVAVNNVVIEKQPKAVASLSPVLTRVLTDLGYTAKIVGYTTGDVLPEIPPITEPETKKDEGFRWFWEKKEEPVSSEPEKPLVSGEIGTNLKPDMEKIGEYKPEIIFTATPLTKAQMDKLDAVKIKVIVIPAAKNLEELKSMYNSIFTVMSGQIEADSIGKALTEQISADANVIATLVPQTKLTYMYIENLDPIIATGDSYESSLLSFVATNVFESQKNYTITKEELAAADPDVIIYSSDIDSENIKQSKLFKDKKAVKEEKLIPVDPALLCNQTKQAPESIRAIGKLLYPDVDFSQQVDTNSSSESK